jgi:hypothetical protein
MRFLQAVAAPTWTGYRPPKENVMRMLIPAALAAALAAAPALAQTGAGQIVCENDIKQLQRTLNDRQPSMSPIDYYRARERLETLAGQCKQNYDLAAPGIARLRQDWNAPQTATNPGFVPAPGYQ